MIFDHPPANLPQEYREIWQILKAADEKPGSRQALARELGVSTETLQRILVRGDVPRFREPQSTRIRHAWTRTLSRLARHFGRPPRDWVEGVGIGWDDSIRRVSARALSGSGGASVELPPSGSERRPEPPSRFSRPTLEAVRLVVADLPPYSAHLPIAGASFLEAIARRLLLTLQPGIEITTTRLPEAQARAAADEGLRGGFAPIVVGVRETVAERVSGRATIELPGVRQHLSAMAIRHRKDGAPLPGWNEVAASRSSAEPHILVPAGDPAGGYVRSQLGIPGERIAEHADGDPARLADAILAETRRHPRQRTVLIAASSTCYRVAAALWRRTDFAPRFVVEELRGAPQDCPAYPLGLRLPAEWASWIAPLEEALRSELFGTYRRETARLYAEMIAVGGIMDLDDQVGRREAPAPRPPSRAGWVVEGFAEARAEFQSQLCAELVRILIEAWTARLGAAGPVADGRALHRTAVQGAARQASALLPPAWQDVLSAVLGEDAPRSGAGLQSHFCRSCSVSLLDRHNRGVSDRYCRCCSDEEGRLRTREDVHGLIANWMRDWQAGLSEAEARRRAGLLMQAMPAWDEN